MVKKHPDVEFYFLFDRKYDPDFIYAENVKAIVIPPPTRHVVLISYWFDIAIKRALKKIQPDLFFSPDNIAMTDPVCKTVTTIHDINYISNPGNFSNILRNFYAKRTPDLVLNTDKIVAVSEYTKGALKRLLKVPDDKIEVIYNACRPGFHPVEEEVKLEVRNRYSEGKDFFVFVGGLYQRKNLVRMVQGFEIFKKNTGSDMKLLIVGRILPEAKDLVKTVEHSDVRKDIVLTDRINDDNEVKRIMASALALTYVSVLEGFGLPMVEAMSSGIPVITSNTSCMPEIGGDAAIYANPIDPKDIADKMEEMYSNESLRNRLIRNAKTQSEKFDWDKSADKLWEVFQEVINT